MSFSNILYILIAGYCLLRFSIDKICTLKNLNLANKHGEKLHYFRPVCLYSSDIKKIQDVILRHDPENNSVDTPTKIHIASMIDNEIQSFSDLQNIKSGYTRSIFIVSPSRNISVIIGRKHMILEAGLGMLYMKDSTSNRIAAYDEIKEIISQRERNTFFLLARLCILPFIFVYSLDTLMTILSESMTFSVWSKIIYWSVALVVYYFFSKRSKNNKYLDWNDRIYGKEYHGE